MSHATIQHTVLSDGMINVTGWEGFLGREGIKVAYGEEVLRLYTTGGAFMVCNGDYIFKSHKANLTKGIYAPEAYEAIVAEMNICAGRLRECIETAGKTIDGVTHIGGDPSCSLRVLDCQHSDGSVYSWRVERRDRTEYRVGDVVEVEHLGPYSNEFLPVVGVRLTPEHPACKVVRRISAANDEE